jgi:predicted amidohydrolase
MLVAALSLSGIDLNTIEGYISGIKALLAKPKPKVAVLPAHSALVLGLAVRRLNNKSSVHDTFACYLDQGAEWNSEFLNLHRRLAEELSLYFVIGTVIEKEEDHLYQTAFCFNPEGKICCTQRQTHLTLFERELRLCRGERVQLFQVGKIKVGLIVGNDIRQPEVGRIMVMMGADLLLCSDAIAGKTTCWQQVAGAWAQVQQNQVFAVEAQLNAPIAGCCFGATLAITAPCEITNGNTGYLIRGNPGSPVIFSELNFCALDQIRSSYPLLKLLNPGAYDPLFRSAKR